MNRNSGKKNACFATYGIGVKQAFLFPLFLFIVHASRGL